MSEAGLSRTVFYRHFEDLPRLMLSLLEHVQAELRDAMKLTVEAPGDWEAFVDTLRGAVDVWDRHGPLMRAIVDAGSYDEEIDDAYGALREGWVALSTQLLDRDVAEGRLAPVNTLELSRALTALNESYLMETLGRVPPRPGARTCSRRSSSSGRGRSSRRTPPRRTRRCRSTALSRSFAPTLRSCAMPSGPRRTLAGMPRPSSIHVCSECGHESAKWHGQCPGCSGWNTMVETAVAVAPARGARKAGAAGSDARPSVPRALGAVDAVRVARLKTGIGELDRVLGGGLVPGSLVLIGGSPGIGKSTLTTMALANLAAAGKRVLYVSAEESPEQVRLRAERLGPSALMIPVVADTALETVLATLEHERPDVCVVDSVQTIHSAGAERGARHGRPGARGGGRGHARRQGERDGRVARRARDEGGLARGPARARAPRRLRPAVRGRARADLPHGARAQEPLRVHLRRRRVRDARRRPRRSARRLGTLRRRGDAGARLRRARGDGGLAPAARRGPGARVAERARAAAARRVRDRPQPPRARARGARPPRWHRARERGRVRQRRRRRARRRARRRPRGCARRRRRGQGPWSRRACSPASARSG